MALLRTTSTSQGVDAAIELTGRSEADAEVAIRITADNNIKCLKYIAFPPCYVMIDGKLLKNM
jgi:hypothetical protein